NLRAVVLQPTTYDQVAGRIDYVLNPNMNLWGRYSFGREDDYSPNVVPDTGTTQKVLTETLSLHHAWTLSPRMINEVKGNYLRFAATRLGDLAYKENVGADIGILGVSANPLDWGIPDFRGSDQYCCLGEPGFGHP